MQRPRNRRSLQKQNSSPTSDDSGSCRGDADDGRSETSEDRCGNDSPNSTRSFGCSHCCHGHGSQTPSAAGPSSSTSPGYDTQARLALYIAMAHGGLALSIALLYGLSRLLEEYWRPIQWALLLSIPLRELHTALVSFWTHPLRLGLPETLLALPLAALGTVTSSLLDSYIAILHLLRRSPNPSIQGAANAHLGFAKLMQWLVSFALFVIVHERLGLLLSLLVFAAIGLIASFTKAYPSPTRRHATVAATLTAINSRRRMIPPPTASSWNPFARVSRYVTSSILHRLNTVVGIGLIAVMIVGSMSGFFFFSYKIGVEGKGAVISLKTHLEQHNYAEWIGLWQWIDDRNVPDLIEAYSSKLYDTVSQYVDSLASQYNATEVVDGLKHYLVRPIESSSALKNVTEPAVTRPFSKMMCRVKDQLYNREWSSIYADLNKALSELVTVMSREDLVDKLKEFALRSIHVSEQVLASGTVVLAGGANLCFSIVLSIISGAAGLLNFLSQLTVFFWLLYYLITSTSAGVMDNVLGMLPIPRATRARCAQVLDQAVSSVLLASVKVALFGGCLTYLLFRFYRIHFLYVSTFLAWGSAIFPITPYWLSSIPAATQLAMEARYVEAVLLTAVHLVLLDYGTAVIQDEIPGQSAYLTGLSILGGMALFQSVIEGAIMGPLLMTVMIAMKNLYAEFVLSSAKLRRTLSGRY